MYFWQKIAPVRIHFCISEKMLLLIKCNVLNGKNFQWCRLKGLEYLSVICYLNCYKKWANFKDNAETRCGTLSSWSENYLADPAREEGQRILTSQTSVSITNKSWCGYNKYEKFLQILKMRQENALRGILWGNWLDMSVLAQEANSSGSC